MSTSASGIIDSSSSSSSSAAAYIDSVEVWAAAKIIGYNMIIQLIYKNDNNKNDYLNC